MRVVRLDIIQEAQKRHAGAKSRLSAWTVEAKAATWTSFQDVRDRYPKTDKVGDRYVFDIGGNRYRLITSINFGGGVIVVRWFGTHADYSKIKVEEA